MPASSAAASAAIRTGVAATPARCRASETAPACVFSETFYAAADLKPGSRLPLPDYHEDRGLYVVEGSISIAGQAFELGRMMVFRPGDQISVAAGPAGARLIILGGATLGGPRYIWWNFVASSQDRIEAAKDEWRKTDWGRGLFDLPADDRGEFTPLSPVRQLLDQLVSTSQSNSGEARRLPICAGSNSSRRL